MARLDGKIAIITGGARGQGAAEGALFASEGATVILTDVLDDEGARTAKEIGGSYLHHDVTSEDGWAGVVKQVMDDHGRIDVLINNAGIFQPSALLDTSLEHYMRTITVNQVGVFLGLRDVGAAMAQGKSGSIVNISSIAGLRGSQGAIAYGASKWAVRGMTKTAALELARHGVRVNSIHPGIIDTAMIAGLPGVDADGPDSLSGRIPMRRVAEAAEVANLALYLASDESSYSTGSEFVVDGGMTAGM